jgi:hypothetical protein
VRRRRQVTIGCVAAADLVLDLSGGNATIEATRSTSSSTLLGAVTE